MNKLLFDLDFTSLEKKDVFGKDRLSIFDKYGTKAAITDFAIFLGGRPYFASYTKDGERLENRTCAYYIKTKNTLFDYVNCVDIKGNSWRYSGAIPAIGIRPVTSYSSIYNHPANINKLGIKEIELGQYPQTVENIQVSNELEKLYNSGKLQKTGKEYTTNMPFVLYRANFSEPIFEERKHIEYEYNGQKYICILGDINCVNYQLSDGRLIEYNKPYFIKIEPIIWLLDEKRNELISKKILFSGMPFYDRSESIIDFKDTIVEWYLDTHFRKDIIPQYKYYLVKYKENNRYYSAYEEDGILRDVLTDIVLVPEDASFFPEDAFIYSEIKEASKEDVINNLLINGENYLLHLKWMFYENKILYNKLKKEYIGKDIEENIHRLALNKKIFLKK